MIEISNLSKTFSKDDKPVEAVKDLSVTFDKGITCLVGENGAGKSTLFRLIAGIITKDSGEIKVDGIDNVDEKAKANLFLLPDDPYAPNRYTPLEAAKFYGIFYKLDLEKFKKILSHLSLPLDRKISTFSKGMRRQVFLAIAFSVDSKNILLDEAFDGLDPLVLELIRGELIKLTMDEGKTIVISSHNMVSVQTIADSIMVLYRGSLSTKEEKGDMGKELVKYQLATKIEVTEKELVTRGFFVVSIKRVGTVTQIVLIKKDGIEETLKDLYQPLFVEQCPIDPSEVITLQLLLAKKEGKENE